ncbi:hypothetical protein FOA52_016143 [Chlamydomonas sp. UWO 241]|nr:hypothetical protein FOA52_016143 [Chlamydomonas sp. UWO 241]
MLATNTRECRPCAPPCTPPQGFTVASTHKPCTKGLWLWSKPFERTMPGGKKMHLLLVDCEGIDAFDQTMDYSTQIFSLGVLLSSLLIFNQMGGIDESSIDKLSSVCEFAKLIQKKSSAGGSASVEGLSPSFLWLLRDFQFNLTEDGRQITTRDYMEEVLRDMPGASAPIVNRNAMRTSVKSLFPDRDAFSLVRPCLEESDLANMDKLPPGQLRPEFRAGFDRLTDLVLSKALPKQFHGGFLSGSALASFAQSYVDFINKGDVPSISSTWAAVMRSENQRALESATAAYERAFATGGGGASPGASGAGDLSEHLDGMHAAALEAALSELDQQALGDAGERRVFEQKLRDGCGSRFAVVKQARLADADRRATELLSVASQRLMPLLHADPLDVDTVDAELASTMRAYDGSAGGPSKYKRAAEFVINAVVPGLQSAVRKSQSVAASASAKLKAKTTEAAEASAKATDLGHRVKALESTESGLRSQMTRAEAELTRARTELSSREAAAAAAAAATDSMRGDLSGVRTAAAVAEQRATAAEAALEVARSSESHARDNAARAAGEATRSGTELAELKRQLDAARASERDARAEASAVAARATSEAARLIAELSKAVEGRNAVAAELSALRTDAESAISSRDAAAAQMTSEVEGLRARAAELLGAQQRIFQLEGFLSERETALTRLQSERGFLQTQVDTLHHAHLIAVAAADAAAAAHAASATAAAHAERSDAAYADVDMGDAMGGDDGDGGEEGGPSKKKARTASAAAVTKKRGRAAAGGAAAGGAGGAGAGPSGAGAAPRARRCRHAPRRRRHAPRRCRARRRRRVAGAVQQREAGGARHGAHDAAAAGVGGVVRCWPAAAGQQQARELPAGLDRFTMAECKAWLTGEGLEADVFALNSRKAKKGEWVAMGTLYSYQCDGVCVAWS